MKQIIWTNDFGDRSFSQSGISTVLLYLHKGWYIIYTTVREHSRTQKLSTCFMMPGNHFFKEAGLRLIVDCITKYAYLGGHTFDTPRKCWIGWLWPTCLHVYCSLIHHHCSVYIFHMFRNSCASPSDIFSVPFFRLLYGLCFFCLLSFFFNFPPPDEKWVNDRQERSSFEKSTRSSLWPSSSSKDAIAASPEFDAKSSGKPSMNSGRTWLETEPSSDAFSADGAVLSWCVFLCDEIWSECACELQSLCFLTPATTSMVVGGRGGIVW